MFASTLANADAFLKSLCCNKCNEPSDKLQFIGSSCKHVFCWTCINEICEGKSFPLCPICSLPVGLQHIKPAALANDLFQNLLSLTQKLAEFNLSQTDQQTMLSQIDQQTLLNVIESHQQRRTAEEFCSTQQQQIDDGSKSGETNAELPSSFESVSTSNNDNSYYASRQADIALFTQPMDTTADGPADVQMTQQLRVYKKPEQFKFFKRPPSNTFADVIVKKRRISDQKSSDARNESENPDGIASPTTSRITNSSSPPKRQRCTLLNAVISGYKLKVLEALEEGEDANDCDNFGFTALYHAAARNFTELCRILIENGAVINAHCGALCETALHAAVRYGARDAVDYLLRRGANRWAYNLKGETPMDLAVDEKMQAVFNEISPSFQIVYPSRRRKRYSIFLSATLTDEELRLGTLFLKQRRKDAKSLETATHLIVPKEKEYGTAEVSVEIMEAIVLGQYVVTSDWLEKCLEADKILDEECYEVRKINRSGQLLAEGSCSVARKNHAKMKPGLFRGCQFYFCKHKYLPYGIRELKKLVELAGGVILSREPIAQEYIESGLKPYHAMGVRNVSNKISGLFAVYMPGQFMPRRVVEEKFINLVTPLWISDCIAKFTLLPPEDR